MPDVARPGSKVWEDEWTSVLPPHRPWIVRLDGRTFHRWTRGLKRPFDDALREAMVHTARETMIDAGADFAYTQSDEVTLVLWHTGRQEPAFGGKVQKLASLLAARASVAFNEFVSRELTEHASRAGMATFDARVFAVPGLAEAAAAVRERQRDAWRNAIQSIGHWQYGHKALQRRKNRDIAQALDNDGMGMNTWAARLLPTA